MHVFFPKSFGKLDLRCTFVNASGRSCRGEYYTEQTIRQEVIFSLSHKNGKREIFLQ